MLINQSKLTPPAVLAIGDHPDLLALLELMAMMVCQATVAATENQAAQPPYPITADMLLQSNAHVQVRLVDLAVPDPLDPLAILVVMVSLVIMVPLEIPVILVDQEIMADKETQVETDAQEPQDNYNEAASHHLVNRVSPVVQALQVAPDAQAIQVEMVFPATLVHKETAVHKDHLAAQEAPEDLVALANLDLAELAISVHQRVWPQATRIPSGISPNSFY